MGPHLPVGTNLLHLPECDNLPLWPCFSWVTKGPWFVSLELKCTNVSISKDHVCLACKCSLTWFTRLPLLEGHRLFGSGNIVCKELVGCLFIQYKCPPDIVKYCWYSVLPPLKEVVDYGFASYIFFLSSLDIETRNKGPGCENQLLKIAVYLGRS